MQDGLFAHAAGFAKAHEAETANRAQTRLDAALNFCSPNSCGSFLSPSDNHGTYSDTTTAAHALARRGADAGLAAKAP